MPDRHSSPEKRLLRAIDDADARAAGWALAAGADPNACIDGRPLLVHVVCTWGQRPEAFGLTTRLLDAGALVNARDARGCTALSYTALDGRDHTPGNPHNGFLPQASTEGWDSLGDGRMMAHLLAAGAELHVPLGHLSPSIRRPALPRLPTSERTLAIRVFQTLLSLATDANPMLPREEAWAHVTRACATMERTDLEHANRRGDSPLATAIAHGQEETVLALLRRGVVGSRLEGTHGRGHADARAYALAEGGGAARAFARFLAEQLDLPSTVVAPSVRHRL